MVGLSLIIIRIIACKKREAKFLSFYNFFKGFYYWFYAPLLYAAVSTIAPLIKASTTDGDDFNTAIIIIVVFLGIAVAELIAYKVAQREEENIWKKWVEFASHWMVGGTVTLMAIYGSLPDTKDQLKYLIPNLFIGLFAVFYLIVYKFRARVVERIFSTMMDVIIIVVLNLFIFSPDTIYDNHMDFYALVVVLVIELIETFIKFVMFCKSKGDEEDDAVNPEKDSPKRGNNSFGASINPEGSYDGLNNSGIRNSGINSPPQRRGGAPPRRR